MSTPKPLSPQQARRTLVERFAPVADRAKQLKTKFGLRSKRVFLVWSKWDGRRRGEGSEEVVARVEVLPTPRVVDLSAVSFQPFSAGKLPVGTIRVDEVSLRFTRDELVGKRVPVVGPALAGPCVDFFFEIVEDGRGDDPPVRQRFRVFGEPDRQEGRLGWSVLLERASEDLDRRGRPQDGPQKPDPHGGLSA